MRSNETWGRYRLQSLIGRGQSSEVWAAIDEKGGGLVALKLFEAKAGAASRAEAEYRTATAFDHPHILRPIELLALSAGPALVLPLCPGRSVDGVAGFVEEGRIWQLLTHVASALACIHAQGYVHGDVSPSNILWTGSRFLLSDFGACRQLAAGPAPAEAAGSSYKYQAPEAVGGDASAASDIWSLGACAFHLFMGSPVFNGYGGRAQLPQSPVPYMRKDRRELSELVCRCLSYSPAQRPSAADIAELAEGQWESLSKARPARPKKQLDASGRETAATDFWPEEMIE